SLICRVTGWQIYNRFPLWQRFFKNLFSDPIHRVYPVFGQKRLYFGFHQKVLETHYILEKSWLGNNSDLAKTTVMVKFEKKILQHNSHWNFYSRLYLY